MNAHSEMIPADRPRAFAGNDELAIRVGRWVACALGGDEELASQCRAVTGWLIEKAQAEGTTTAGAVLVPQEIAAEIIAWRALSGVFRFNADVRRMTADELAVPVRSGGPTTYFIGENQQITESSAGWSNITLTAKKLGALTRISSELDEDSAADLGRFFVEELAASFADVEDGCGFVGDGTGTYAGMRGLAALLVDGAHDAGKVAASSGHDTFPEIDGTDLANLMAKLPEQSWPGAKFYCSGYAAATCFARLGATTGGVVMTATGPRPMLSYAGIPIVITPKLPGSGTHAGAVMILFGDLRAAAILGSRREIIVQSSTQRYLDLDQIAIRGTSRFHVNCHNVGDGTNAGAVVGLVGTS